MNKITIGEFFFLQSLFNENLNVNLSLIGEVNKEKLESFGFIKILEQDEVVIREKGRELFIDKRNNFYRFLNAFPIKTPSGRYLSPKNLEGVAVQKIKAKWKSLFKGDIFSEDLVIRVLEAEVEWRKKTNQQEFMNACEAWLNMANYEKFEYLLEDEEKDRKKEDYYSM